MTVYCTAPWVGLTVREDGHVRTCCDGTTSLGNLNQTTIDKIIDSELLNEIRHDMLSNSPNLKNCANCVKSESQSGLASLRQHYNKFYSVNDYSTFKLKNLDIRWNNICNLGCMYCSTSFSSTWQDRLSVSRSPVVKNYQDELLNWILEQSDQLQEIMLVGGEPMLMKQNYALLNQVPDQCKVSIITNLSYDLPNLPCITQLLSRPKENTVWNVSLENINGQFEYARSGGKWEQVRKNLEYLTIHWPETISINFVYSMFSAFGMLETIQTLHNIGIKKINMIPISHQPTMDVFNMPHPVRLAAAKELEAVIHWHFENLHPNDKDLYPLQGADAILNQLLQSAPSSVVSSEDFLNKIAWYDQYHHINFKQLWPNVIDLVEKYL